ncbi:hypothetical protein [Fusobacterium perfoetens]|uniref:hypothetical protein n=1 Tax=Fusobacterium perfoetens TaxID=852 RepID=UPI00055AF36F|nr:hypothetical protein [Fusobacterium perfoetens]MCI6152727.1 hypothetical protein [Fusobacterium perfoetens]MDY3236621.1 hypothetical protein [Fusobacterium perfoetens]
MKKQILAGLFILSTIALAHPTKIQGTHKYKKQFECSQYSNFKSKKMSNCLSPELQKEVKKTNLEIQEKEIQVKRLILEEKIDWNKVEELNKEIALERAKLKTKMQKYFVENPIPEPIKVRQVEENPLKVQNKE